MDFTKRTIFKIFAKKESGLERSLLHVPQEHYTLHSNSNRSVGTIHGSLALIGLLPCFTPWHFSVFITN